MRVDPFYSAFPHSSTLRNSDAVIALNNRFPNLFGYAVLNYLHEMMCENKRTLLLWEKDSIAQYAQQMNTDVDKVEAVVAFLLQTPVFQIKKSIVDNARHTFLFDPYLVEVMTYYNGNLTYEAVKTNIAHQSLDQKLVYMSEEREYAHMVREIRKDLILTPELKAEALAAFPDYDIDKLFSDWCYKVTNKTKIASNFKTLNRDNYQQAFFMFLNKYTKKG